MYLYERLKDKRQPMYILVIISNIQYYVYIQLFG